MIVPVLLIALSLSTAEVCLGSGTAVYEDPGRLFRLNLPAQLKVNFTKENPRGWSADNRMPFDYVNFVPADAAPGLEPFELGVGVHWNRDRLATRDFADKKDEGLLAAGAQIKVIRQSEAVVAGIKGVRDDFLMLQPYGWRSYSRIIIPHEENFFVFLGTLGEDQPRPELERIYQEIVEGFRLR